MGAGEWKAGAVRLKRETEVRGGDSSEARLALPRLRRFETTTPTTLGGSVEKNDEDPEEIAQAFVRRHPGFAVYRAQDKSGIAQLGRILVDQNTNLGLHLDLCPIPS